MCCSPSWRPAKKYQPGPSYQWSNWLVSKHITSQATINLSYVRSCYTINLSYVRCSYTTYSQESRDICIFLIKIKQIMKLVHIVSRHQWCLHIYVLLLENVTTKYSKYERYKMLITIRFKCVSIQRDVNRVSSGQITIENVFPKAKLVRTKESSLNSEYCTSRMWEQQVVATSGSELGLLAFKSNASSTPFGPWPPQQCETVSALKHCTRSSPIL